MAVEQCEQHRMRQIGVLPHADSDLIERVGNGMQRHLNGLIGIEVLRRLGMTVSAAKNRWAVSFVRCPHD